MRLSVCFLFKKSGTIEIIRFISFMAHKSFMSPLVQKQPTTPTHTHMCNNWYCMFNAITDHFSLLIKFPYTTTSYCTHSLSSHPLTPASRFLPHSRHVIQSVIPHHYCNSFLLDLFYQRRLLSINLSVTGALFVALYCCIRIVRTLSLPNVVLGISLGRSLLKYKPINQGVNRIIIGTNMVRRRVPR